MIPESDYPVTSVCPAKRYKLATDFLRGIVGSETSQDRQCANARYYLGAGRYAPNSPSPLPCLDVEHCDAEINMGAAWHCGTEGFPHHPPCACDDCVWYYYSLK